MRPLVLDWPHIAMTLKGQILLLSNNISGASKETHLILKYLKPLKLASLVLFDGPMQIKEYQSKDMLSVFTMWNSYMIWNSLFHESFLMSGKFIAREVRKTI